MKKSALFMLLGILLCTSGYSQKDNKNFTLSVQEDLIPFADFHYQNPTGHTTSQIWLNYIPSVELSFRNIAFARVRFNTLIADKVQDPQEIMSVNPLDIRAKYPKNRFAYSVSAVCGYNFLNKSNAHQLRLGLVVGFVHQTTDFYTFGGISHEDEITNHFQIGGEISYKYFIPKWNYRWGVGASCEYSYSKGYDDDPYITNINLNITYRILNF